jgi:RNA polymerase sigma-70 factor (ECF subfamily)
VEDDEIRAALRRGDDNLAFRLLLRAHGEAVFTRCYRILRNRSAADDVMQEAMMAAFKSRSRLLEVDQLRGWVIRIAVRKSLDALRSGRRKERLERDVVAGEPPETANLLDRLGSTEELRALEECLAALDPELAIAVEMRYRDGMSWAQIADAVAIPADAIRMRVQRGALKNLHDCLASKEVMR